VVYCNEYYIKIGNAKFALIFNFISFSNIATITYSKLVKNDESETSKLLLNFIRFRNKNRIAKIRHWLCLKSFMSKIIINFYNDKNINPMFFTLRNDLQVKPIF
jgi:hypothetical protein